MKRILSTLVLALSALAAQAAVDVNKASQAELEAVKGIGPGMATRILDARGKAPFAHWADLVERVRGLGPGNAARLSDAGLTVGGTTFSTPAPEPRAARRSAKAEQPADKATAKP